MIKPQLRRISSPVSLLMRLPIGLPVPASSRRMSFKNVFLGCILLLFSQLLVACGSAHEFNGIVYNPPIVAPELQGIDQTGEPFSMDKVKGKVTLLFFGYTNCPDVCPLTMGQITTIYRQLSADSNDLAESNDLSVIFASTDPERDTPQVLAQYIDLFDSSFWGVQIPQTALAEVMSAYSGLAQKDELPEGKTAEQYTITHSNWIYAIDREGNLRLIFSSQLQTQQIADDVKYLLSE